MLPIAHRHSHSLTNTGIQLPESPPSRQDTTVREASQLSSHWKNRGDGISQEGTDLAAILKRDPLTALTRDLFSDPRARESSREKRMDNNFPYEFRQSVPLEADARARLQPADADVPPAVQRIATNPTTSGIAAQGSTTSPQTGHDTMGVAMGRSGTVTDDRTDLTTTGLSDCGALAVLTNPDDNGVYRSRTLAHFSGGNLNSPMDGRSDAFGLVNDLRQQLQDAGGGRVIWIGGTGSGRDQGLRSALGQEDRNGGQPLLDLFASPGVESAITASNAVTIAPDGSFTIQDGTGRGTLSEQEKRRILQEADDTGSRFIAPGTTTTTESNAYHYSDDPLAREELDAEPPINPGGAVDENGYVVFDPDNAEPSPLVGVPYEVVTAGS